MIRTGTGHIAILDEDFKDVLNAFDDGNVFTVWVLGGDARWCLELADFISETTQKGVFGSLLDDCADRVERDLLDLDQQVLMHKDDRLAWSASLIGDRSPYAGDLQLNVARYLAIDKIVKEGGRHLFFVEDDALAQALEGTAKNNSLPISWLGKVNKPSQCAGVLRARASALKISWQQSSTLKKYRQGRPAPWRKLSECDVVLVDWARHNSFNVDGETVCTGNMEGMADVLRKAGLKVGFIANPLSWTQPYASIAENVSAAFDPVVMIDECRGVGTVLRGAWATWRMVQRLKHKLSVAGYDLSVLFDFECTKDNRRSQSTLAYTYVDVAKTLELHGVYPKALIYPFENQGWERALIDGARRHLPNTRIIAYQHAPFASRYFGVFPAQSDIDAGRLPDQLIVMGPHYLQEFTGHGWPPERLTLGGSLRFESALNHPPPLAQGDGRTVLAASSIDFKETLDLVMKATVAVMGITNAHLIVNFHPVLEQGFRDDIRDALVGAMGEDVLKRVELSVKRVSNLIHCADVLLYNTSGAVFDACFAGVPTVYVAVDGQLSYDKVPGGASRRVTDSEDLKAMLNKILLERDSRVSDMSIGGTMSPVDESAIVNAVIGT